MGDNYSKQIDIISQTDEGLQQFLKDNAMSLKIEELKKIPGLINRHPTITELHIFNTQWSEHTSYKSSKDILNQLPTDASTVILGPKEDAGIAKFTDFQQESYGIVMSHESHNHPSQVVPFEGAATGIGGNVRDVLCMGARVIACADPLRFGNPAGESKNKVKYIANSVIDGIAGYGNPLGVPVIAGDIYFNKSFDDNCLVNVVTLGLVKESEIIHSYAPENAEGYDIIVVGKATDNSGFGGAAFASLILDDKDRESNRGAVQVPDPFLKNVLVRATEQVFAVSRKEGITLGFKDMGAGGIMCSTTELVSSAGYGAQIDIDRIHVSMQNLPPFITMCSETQERFCWISPPSFTETILKIYNEEFNLPKISKGAAASVVGKVTKSKNYVLYHNKEKVCDVDVNLITEGIKYSREEQKAISREISLSEPSLQGPFDLKDISLKILSHENVASREICYKHYDTEVQGHTIVRPGEADAGVIAPIDGCSNAIALSVDSNPRYSRIDPYWGAVNAVAESQRNVCAVGASPIAMTDCLNYGNPEKKEAFYDFKQGVKGITDAAKALTLFGKNEPTPFISGNVSFYNESSTGKSVDPSAIIGCLGVIDDLSTTITTQIKKEGSSLFMVGQRLDELGGSVFYDVLGYLGKNVPKPELSKAHKMNESIVYAIKKRLLLSCHDISDGGLFVTLAEMALGKKDGNIGATVSLDFSTLSVHKTLFSESQGYVFESADDNAILDHFKEYGITPIKLGETKKDVLNFTKGEETVLNLNILDMREAWTNGLQKALH